MGGETQLKIKAISDAKRWAWLKKIHVIRHLIEGDYHLMVSKIVSGVGISYSSAQTIITLVT